ncbi:MAG TPA: sigma-70 family RNA polymerase sigma factor [Polyangiales bacterium]|jgi:RNA polymerase sigma-70 factor (ECF subfamily)|nr:sigma-70 family RNA polymerase sigma factor [Polyangiales bacterium]
MPAIPCHERPERVRFERSVLPLTRSLRSSALRMARSPADADDLVQETVLRAWRFWPRYSERDCCRAWLHRILRNTFITRCRERRREREILEQAGLRAHHDEAQVARFEHEDSQGGLDDTMTHGLCALAEEQRRVLLLVDVERRSYKEAAATLGVPIGTVMSRLHRARGALRRRLESGLPLPVAGHA